jgi:hypothetical protein
MYVHSNTFTFIHVFAFIYIYDHIQVARRVISVSNEEGHAAALYKAAKILLKSDLVGSDNHKSGNKFIYIKLLY